MFYKLRTQYRNRVKKTGQELKRKRIGNHQGEALASSLAGSVAPGTGDITHFRSGDTACPLIVPIRWYATLTIACTTSWHVFWCLI